MKENKTQFFISDKPIDLQEIASNIEEPFEMPRDCGELHTITFDCKATKETADWFKLQMDELNKEAKRLEDLYLSIAKYNADNLFQSLFKSHLPENKDSDEKAKELLSAIIFNALCKGWNDCFDYNVKHEKQQTTL